MAAVALLRLRVRQQDKANEANESSNALWRLCCPFVLTGGPSASVWTPHGACDQHSVGHDGQAEMAIRPPSGVRQRIFTPF